MAILLPPLQKFTHPQPLSSIRKAKDFLLYPSHIFNMLEVILYSEVKFVISNLKFEIHGILQLKGKLLTEDLDFRSDPKCPPPPKEMIESELLM